MMRKIVLVVILFLPSFIFGQTNLQNLVNQSLSKGYLKLPSNQNYVLSKPLILPSNFRLDGNGCTISPSKEWRSANERYSALIEIVGVSNLEISNLTLDNMARRGIEGMPSYSILITSSSFVSLSNNIFKDLGLNISEKAVAGSPFILVLAQEAPKDFSYLPSKYTNTVGSVSNVTIKNNTFSNSEFVNSFAIRMLTLWNKGRKKDEIRSEVTNILLEGNKFIGEYDWNTIEMAGPATRDINVVSNIITGKSATNIDVDKGASNIIINSNVIRNAGLPNRHKTNINVRVSPIMVHGSPTSYFCEGVEVSNNIIDGIENPTSKNSRYLYSSGIGVWYASDVKILNNEIKNAFVNKNYGTAICLDQSVQNIAVEGNMISEVKWGIVITPNINAFSDVRISNNTISSNSEPMLLLSGKKGNFSHLRLKSNKIKSKDGKSVKIGQNIKSVESDIK